MVEARSVGAATPLLTCYTPHAMLRLLTGRGVEPDGRLVDVDHVDDVHLVRGRGRVRVRVWVRVRVRVRVSGQGQGQG